MTNIPRDPSDESHPLYDATEDPSHPFYEGDNTDGKTTATPSEDGHGDKVGPGSPPKQYTWKRGCRSPNPKGRPKKIPSMRPDLKKALETALNEKVVVTKDKKEAVMTKATLAMQQLVNQFAKGDRHARHDVLQYAAQLGVDLQARDVINEALGNSHQAIVDAAIRRHQPQLPAEAEAVAHVKAPPDLVDDDVTTPEPNLPSAAPKPDTPAKTPVVSKGDGEPQVGTIEHVRAQRDRNLAYQRKIQGLS